MNVHARANSTFAERPVRPRLEAPTQCLDWQVDPKSLEGDDGELATRPRHEES